MHLILLSGILLTSTLALADGTAVISAAGAVTGASSLSFGQLLDDIVTAAQGFGGLSWALKIAVVIMCLIGLMKVSFLSSLWAKLGAFQAWLAPILGLALGICLLAANGTITLAGVMAYVGAGGGAVFIRELLEGVKAIPGLGPMYVTILNLIESALPQALSAKKPTAPTK